ncbi:MULTISPECIES: hypothetical protein [unclassified Serratia (in: enterobacteria)]|uniref:hypothetical protein n=1 Tax=unclassified Serratia (in: enterobacteria) TaxID=2647522 RepID=UPI0030763ABA
MTNLAAVVEPDLATSLLAVKAIWLAMASGFQEHSGMVQSDTWLSRGGMDSMLLTIWAVIDAVTFGLMVDGFGLRNKLITPLLLRAKVWVARLPLLKPMANDYYSSCYHADV